MEHETARRVWAAGGYAGLTKPKLAAKLKVSVDTLKRTVDGERNMRAFESEEAFLRAVSWACDLPLSFFTVDFHGGTRAEPDALSRLEDQLRAIEAELQGEQARSEHMRSQIALLVSRSEPGASEER